MLACGRRCRYENPQKTIAAMGSKQVAKGGAVEALTSAMGRGPVSMRAIGMLVCCRYCLAVARRGVELSCEVALRGVIFFSRFLTFSFWYTGFAELAPESGPRSRLRRFSNFVFAPIRAGSLCSLMFCESGGL